MTVKRERLEGKACVCSGSAGRTQPSPPAGGGLRQRRGRSSSAAAAPAEAGSANQKGKSLLVSDLFLGGKEGGVDWPAFVRVFCCVLAVGESWLP